MPSASDIAALAGVIEHGLDNENARAVLMPAGRLLGLDLACVWEFQAGNLVGPAVLVETAAGWHTLAPWLEELLQDPQSSFGSYFAMVADLGLRRPVPVTAEMCTGPLRYPPESVNAWPSSPGDRANMMADVETQVS